MQNEVIYNQVLSHAQGELRSMQVVKSYAEEGKLMLMLESSDKITIDGKKVDTTGHKKRIQELLDYAKERGFDVDPRAVKHYAADRENGITVEYILLKW